MYSMFAQLFISKRNIQKNNTKNLKSSVISIFPKQSKIHANDSGNLFKLLYLATKPHLCCCHGLSIRCRFFHAIAFMLKGRFIFCWWMKNYLFAKIVIANLSPTRPAAAGRVVCWGIQKITMQTSVNRKMSTSQQVHKASENKRKQKENTNKQLPTFRCIEGEGAQNKNWSRNLTNLHTRVNKQTNKQTN